MNFIESCRLLVLGSGMGAEGRETWSLTTGTVQSGWGETRTT